jgi:putative ABC transport system permease protein
MSLMQLALRNISRSAFRSWVVFLSSLVVAGLALSASLIIQGAESSLVLASQRLGADIIVLPEGTESRVEGALLMGKPESVWMPRILVGDIANIPGVETVSPQVYFGTMVDSPCCAVSDMFMIAFDPINDFTITPWLEQQLGRPLKRGEAIGGRYVFTPAGADGIEIYGSTVKLVGNLEPTGTGLDQTLFLTFDTAYDLALASSTKAAEPMEFMVSGVSAVLVRVRQGEPTISVASRIAKEIPDVSVIESPNLFLTYRKQIKGLIGMVLVVLGITLILSIAIIALIFSLAVNERRREIGVLRALGATRRSIFLSLLTEANLLALSGGLVGTSIASLGVYLFRNLLVASLDMPFLLPSIPWLLLLIAVGLAAALVSVSLSALLPAYVVSRQDPAMAMRE